MVSSEAIREGKAKQPMYSRVPEKWDSTEREPRPINKYNASEPSPYVDIFRIKVWLSDEIKYASNHWCNVVIRYVDDIAVVSYYSEKGEIFRHRIYNDEELNEVEFACLTYNARDFTNDDTIEVKLAFAQRWDFEMFQKKYQIGQFLALRAGATSEYYRK